MEEKNNCYFFRVTICQIEIKELILLVQLVTTLESHSTGRG